MSANLKGNLILEVTNEFSLFENMFVYGEKDYSYKGISSITYFGSSNEINFINVGSESSIFITHDNADKDICIKAESYIIKTKKLQNIQKAANILFKATFKNRLARYLQKLKNVGYITYPQFKKEIKIFSNGDITDGILKFNLATAHEKKSFQIGYDTRFPSHLNTGTYNPFEVIVSESGTAIWNKKIKFSIHKDYDVMVTLLKGLSGQQA